MNNILNNPELDSKERAIILKFLKKVESYAGFLKKLEAKDKKKVKPRKILQREFDNAQKEIISEAYFIENKISSLSVKKKLREIFRDRVKKYILQSKITKRAWEKPRGYPGDYLVFEMIYDSKPVSKGIGLYLDNWIFRHPLTQGIIYRKNRIKYFLVELLSKSNRGLKILNIGCGPSREIRELAEEKCLVNGNSFTCVDQDEEALRLSGSLLKKLNYNNQNISFLKKDALSWLGLGRREIGLPKQDLIYSVGVADYFLKAALEFFIKLYFGLLKPKGKLIVPLCSSHDLKLYTHLAWFCEWHFYKHSANTIKAFFKETLGTKNVKVVWEEKQPVFFVIIEK